MAPLFEHYGVSLWMPEVGVMSSRRVPGTSGQWRIA